ncbi:MAG: hypothetical protein IJ480_08635 [Clostridia bacterium]|nr:hypothetical protein [Clostridia bacterium]
MKKLMKNPRPLFFCLCAMVFLCVLLLVLYLLAEKENTLLKTARSEQFLTLAAGEAEAAEAALENNAPAAEIYHRISAAADYLSMAAPSSENSELIAQLRDTGAVLLQGGILPEETRESLQTFSRSVYDMISIKEYRKASVEEEVSEAAKAAYIPWERLPYISRAEGDTMAESMTETRNILTPAVGRNFVYTCRNVYVKLSQKGGVPLEIAVYTPVQHDPSYSMEECAFRSGRFLESVLPRYLLEKDPVSVAEENSCLRFLYPCGAWQVQVDVRTDTGRMVGLQMIRETEKEQSLSGEKDCSYTYII